LTAKCGLIIREIDDHGIRKKISTRWTGRVDELAEHHNVPAVSSLKESMRVCVADRTADDNAIMFVMIHEMAHIGCDSTGHTPEFWDVMRHLLHAATKAGVWNPEVHDPSSRVCGTPIGPIPTSA
jgi:hypothetical protein